MHVQPERRQVCLEQEEGVLRDLLRRRQEEQPGDVRERRRAATQHQPGVRAAGLLPRLPRHRTGLRVVQRRLPRGQVSPEEGRQGGVPPHRVPRLRGQGGLREPPHLRRLYGHLQVCICRLQVDQMSLKNKNSVADVWIRIRTVKNGIN